MKSIRILMNSDGDHTKSNDGSFHAGCLKKHPMTLGAESCSIPVPYLFHTCWWRFVGTDHLQLTETKDNVHTRNSQPTECTASYVYGY